MNSKKKLLIFMPSIEGGGVEKNFFIISNFLAKKLNKVDISIITADKKYKKNFNKKIKLITPNSNYWSSRGRIVKYFVCLFLLFIYYLNNKKFLIFSFQANIYAIFFSRIFRLKIISRSNSSPSGWSKNFLKNLIFKLLLKSANKIIVNSLDFKKELDKKFGVNSVCIYNPFDSRKVLKLSKKKIRFKFFQNDKKSLKIINVARFTDQKDHLTLLKSFKIIKEKIPFKLLIIGRGANRDKMISYINNNNLKKNIRILDFQKNPIKFMKLAEVFILSSTFEGLPNVLLEALYLKKFVISSDCPTGPREILSGGKGGLLFKVGDEVDLSKKILSYFYNKISLRKKILYGKKELKRFEYYENLKKYSDLVLKYL